MSDFLIKRRIVVLISVAIGGLVYIKLFMLS